MLRGLPTSARMGKERVCKYQNVGGSDELGA